MKYLVNVALLILLLPAGFLPAADTVSFRNQIAPILRDSCLACHGAKKAEGGYRVDSYEELRKAGDSGEMPIATTADQESELLRRIICEDESERMPAETEPLSQSQMELFKKWIAGGAKFDGEQPAQLLSMVIPPPKFADPPDTYDRPIPIVALLVSPDGKQVIAGGYHEVTVWNVGDGKLVRRIKNLGQRIFALAFSADGKTLAVGCGEPGRNGEVRLVDYQAGEVTAVVARSNDVVLDVAFRPGTNEIAVAGSDSAIRIVNAETREDVRTIASHADWVTAVVWSDDGMRLASASRDKSAKVYDGNSGELLSSYLGHGAAVRGVSILADGLQVVSVGDDNKAHRWNIEDAKKVAEIGLGAQGHRLIREGSHLFVPCADSRLLRIDLGNNQILQECKGHTDWVLCAARATDVSGKASDGLLFSGSFDGEVRVWDIADGSLVRGWIAKP
ncbi:MAG: c-type cytochrome domain-containing protein [Rubripirellula sp.]